MPESISLPTANELFQKWKQFLDGGSLTTATYVAGGRPDLVEPLQHLINDYIARSAAGVEETLTAAGEPHDAEPQPTLAGFTVVGPLGEGGMGVVYRVRDALDRELALKMARHGQLTQAGRERFLDEAKAMARLDHPHVAPVIHYETSPTGRPYFVMPIYPGNLTSRLAEYQADPAKAVRLMAAVADGVAHLHSKGFIHRDLKPQNILLDADGQPAVSDFGLVKSVTESGSDVTAAGSGPGSAETKPSGAKRSRTVAGAAVGTRAYMAPEQAAGLTHLANPRWDVWALGVILHELFTGERPASSEAPQRLLDPNEPDNPSPSEVKPGLDRRLERIIQRCLERNEANRYADAGEVARGLRAWLARPRRKRLLTSVISVSLIGLSIAVAGATLGKKRQPDPDQQPERHPREELQSSLEQGTSVILVDDQGRCPYGIRLVGPREGTNPIAVSNGLVVSAVETVLAELVPSGLVPGSFELSGEVRYIKQADFVNSNAGLYYSYYPAGTAADDDHTFAYFTFRDQSAGLLALRKKNNISPDEQAGYYSLGLGHWVSPDARRLPVNSLTMSPSGVFPTPGSDTSERPFRRIELQVTAPTVSVSFQQQPVGVQRHDRMHQQWKNIQPDALTRPPFGPAGAIGLYVGHATVAFRNVRIKPLP